MSEESTTSPAASTVPGAQVPTAPPQVAPVATIATLGQHEGQSVTLRGWLYNLRESGKLLFPIFRDGTGTVQGVAQGPHAGVVRDRDREGARGQAGAGRL
jgi:asparaginyl-tRNA synthetase